MVDVKMSTICRKKPNLIKKDIKNKSKRTNPIRNIKSSIILRKSTVCQKSSTNQKIKKVAQTKIRQSIYAPIKEQFGTVIEYINILDSKKESSKIEDTYALYELIQLVTKQCLMYLSFNYLKNAEERW